MPEEREKESNFRLLYLPLLVSVEMLMFWLISSAASRENWFSRWISGEAVSRGAEDSLRFTKPRRIGQKSSKGPSKVTYLPELSHKNLIF